MDSGVASGAWASAKPRLQTGALAPGRKRTTSTPGAVGGASEKTTARSTSLEVDFLAVNGVEDPDVDIRIACAEIGEPRDQPADGDRRNDRDGERVRPARLPGPAAGRFDVGEGERQPLAQLGSMRQQLRPVAASVEQRSPDPVLEMPHLMADGGLRDTEFLCGTAEVAVARDGFEHAQSIEGRVGHRVASLIR